MKLIDRYILRGTIAPFLFGTCTVIFIFLMQFLMQTLDRLVGKGLSEWLILELIIYNISWMLILAAPMGVLFASLMTFGSMTMSHEVTIIKASGGSLLRMMAPVVVAATFLYFGLLWFNDQILPESNHRVKILMNDITRKKPTFSLESGLFSTQLDGYTILARNVDSISGALSGVTIYDMTKLQNRNIISSDSGWISFTPDYKKLKLELKDGEIHQLTVNSPDNYRVIRFSQYQIYLNAFGFAFEQSSSDLVSKSDREMNIEDMSAIVDTAQANKDRTIYKVDSIFQQHIRDILFGRNNDIPKISNRDLEEQFVQDNEQFKENNIEKKAKAKGDRIEKSDEKVAESMQAFSTRIRRNREQKFNVSDFDTSYSSVLNRVIQQMNIIKSQVQPELNNIRFFNSRSAQYKVEIYKKYSLPFACLVFVLVGCPLGIKTKGGNFGISAGISLGFYIFYWACLIVGEKFADRGIMSPWLAMWLANIVVGFVGIVLTISVNNETFSILSITKLFRKKI